MVVSKNAARIFQYTIYLITNNIYRKFNNINGSNKLYYS